MTDQRRCVIHVVPADLARGAQKRASELRRSLDDGQLAHRVLSIFAVPEPAGLVDQSLSVRPMRRSMFVSPLALHRLRRFLVCERPAVLIAYGSEALRYCSLVRPRSIQLIYSKTGVMDDAARMPRVRAHGWLARGADHLAAVSTETADEAARLLRIPRDRITMVSNGRDPDEFHPAEDRRPGPVRLIWIGHLTQTKRPDLFIGLVAELRRRNHDLEAFVVGDGPTLDTLREPASAHGVVLMGRRHDVAERLRHADIFVFTGQRDGEGLPGVLIEASLSGLPIVTTDVPGARDVVADGKSGFVAPRTTAGLADAVERLIQEEDLRTRMGAEGRRRSEESFTLAASAERWRAVMASVIRA